MLLNIGSSHKTLTPRKIDIAFLLCSFIFLFLGGKKFVLRHRVEIVSVFCPASYSEGTESILSIVERLERESDHLLPSTATVKNARSFRYPHTFLWRKT
jgi:hypothetical protein